MLDRLSQFWNKIQAHLFPEMRQVLPELLPHHEMVVSVLAMCQIENFTLAPSPGAEGGRPPHDRRIMARAFVAKAALNIVTTKELRERLLTDHSLRILCGWDHYFQVPSESVFSRAFAEFAGSQLPELVHSALVKAAYDGGIVMHLSRDSTDVPAREKSAKKKVSQEGKRGGPATKPGLGVCELQAKSTLTHEELLQEIPMGCDSGSKTSAKGTRLFWMGYKLHVDVADGDIPISCALTSASVSDARMAIPMSRKSATRVQALYELMDKGYYANAIRSSITESGRIPIIQYCPKTTKAKSELTDELKARRALNLTLPEDERLKNRTSVERFFGNLKDNFGCRNFRVRTNQKVFCHLMFAVVALTSIQLFRLIL